MVIEITSKNNDLFTYKKGNEVVDLPRQYIATSASGDEIRVEMLHTEQSDLFTSVSFEQISVDGVVFASRNECISALNSVLYSNGGSGSQTQSSLTKVLTKLDTLILKTTEEIQGIKEVDISNKEIKSEIVTQGTNSISKMNELKGAIENNTVKVSEVEGRLTEIKSDLNTFKNDTITKLQKLDENTDELETKIGDLSNTFTTEIDGLENVLKSESDETQVKLEGINTELKKDKNSTSSIIHTDAGKEYIEYGFQIEGDENFVYDGGTCKINLGTVRTETPSGFSPNPVVLGLEMSAFYEPFERIIPWENNPSKIIFGQKILKDTIENLQNLENYENIVGGYVIYSKKMVVFIFKEDIDKPRAFFGNIKGAGNRDYNYDETNVRQGIIYRQNVVPKKYILESFHDNNGNLVKTVCYDGTTTNGKPNIVPIPENFVPGEPYSFNSSTSYKKTNSRVYDKPSVEYIGFNAGNRDGENRLKIENFTSICVTVLKGITNASLNDDDFILGLYDERTKENNLVTWGLPLGDYTGKVFIINTANTKLTITTTGDVKKTRIK